MISRDKLAYLFVCLVGFPLLICGLGFLLQLVVSFVAWDWFSFDNLVYRFCFVSGLILGIGVIIEGWKYDE